MLMSLSCPRETRRANRGRTNGIGDFVCDLQRQPPDPGRPPLICCRTVIRVLAHYCMQYRPGKIKPFPALLSSVPPPSFNPSRSLLDMGNSCDKAILPSFCFPSNPLSPNPSQVKGKFRFHSSAPCETSDADRGRVDTGRIGSNHQIIN